MTVLFGGAVVGILVSSLRPGQISGGAIGLGAWTAVLGDPSFWRAVAFTLWVAAGATVVSAFLGLAAAVLFRRVGLGRVLFGAPIAVPHLVVAALAVVWFAPGGLLDRVGVNALPLVGDAHGFGIIAVYVYKETPFLALLVLAAWDRRTEELEETAATLGASWWGRLRDVVLPRVGPPLAAGSLIVAAFVIGATEVPLVVGSTRTDTIATYALSLTRTDGPAARSAAAAALIVAAMISLALGGLCVTLWRRTRR
jgi:putative spermidine/putrescine transport system permease protein